MAIGAAGKKGLTAGKTDAASAPWLVLLFQFPKGQGSLRVRIWRRLQSMGAVAIKHSAYALPNNDQSREDFAWLVQELTGNGADAVILEAHFIDGMTDRQVQDIFNAARESDYRALAEQLGSAADAVALSDDHDKAQEAARQLLTRGRKQLAEIEAIDFFGADGREAVEAAMQIIQDRLSGPERSADPGTAAMSPAQSAQYKSRTWVTRRGVKVDRIASAWLIRRCIDPEAQFRFVADKGYRPTSDREIRFDMFDAEFTHVGDLCTFEVLLRNFDLADPALAAIAEIVHDIDLKDDKFGHPETMGFASLLSGVVAGTTDDEERIERGSAMLDDLCRYFNQAAS